MAATAVSIGIEGASRPLEVAWCTARYVLFSMHQVVALPLAVSRYGRSVFTGRWERMKTEYRGVGLPVPDRMARSGGPRHLFPPLTLLARLC